ncbi:hypothetical protein [uncultured Bacteroides sp.]|uniref:hypothetical protein n=1 Tax=uncultured Bacteroides sp. TaxID=162156 RepID=UPI002AAAE1BE|nr:hypothetical protein [uncultured Bacteroides sp.]
MSTMDFVLSLEFSDTDCTLKRIIDKFTFTGYFFKELRWYSGELKKIAKLLNVPIKKVPCL